MCGICGVAGLIFNPQQNVFENLLVFNGLRGPHSTGTFFVNGSSEQSRSYGLSKTGGTAWDLFSNPDYARNVARFSRRVLMGHCRFATVGLTGKRNAHPFEFENIAGAHNGTIDLAERKELPGYGHAFKTDSEALLSGINSCEPGEVAGIVGGLRGSWALAWYDKRTNEILFLRNKERLLFYTLSKGGGEVFWSSERNMLATALYRNNVEFQEIQLVPEDTLISFSVPVEYKDKVTLVREVKVVGAPARATVYQYYDHCDDDWWRKTRATQ